jgi:TPR repeat protein
MVVDFGKRKEAEGRAEWADLNGDLVRLVATAICAETRDGASRFRDLLSMTACCQSWRTELLEHPIFGLNRVEFSLPKTVVSNFRFCSLGQDKTPPDTRNPLLREKPWLRPAYLSSLSRSRQIQIPGKLPKLVTRSAHFGNASAALVVALVSTENCMRSAEQNSRRRGGGDGGGGDEKELLWKEYKDLCERMENQMEAKEKKGKQIENSSQQQEQEEYKYSAFDAVQFDLIQLWKRGARLGSKFAQAVLGEAFYCGGGVQLSKIPCTRDIEQAILWLSRAADYGDQVEVSDPMLARSELLLAYIFQDGQEESDGGVGYSDVMLYGRNDRAVQEAVFWFKRAAKHGSSEAQEALRSMYSTGQY